MTRNVDHIGIYIYEIKMSERWFSIKKTRDHALTLGRPEHISNIKKTRAQALYEEILSQSVGPTIRRLERLSKIKMAKVKKKVKMANVKKTNIKIAKTLPNVKKAI